MEKLYNLTAPQNSIWLTEQFGANTNLNNVGGYVFIHDKVCFGDLEKSLKLYVQRNSALGLRIRLVDGEPKQYLASFEDFVIEIVDLKCEKEVQSFNQKMMNIPFDFFDSALYKFIMFRLPDGTGGFYVGLHHIISDAWSMSLFIDEVMDTYAKLIHKEDISFEPFPSYVDFIFSEKDYLNSPRFLKDANFWDSIFETEPEISYISNQTSNQVNTIANRKTYVLSREQCLELNDFCKQNHCSIYTFFMAIYLIYLGRISHTNRPIIGTPILNRTNFTEKHTAGMFISTVPFTVSLEDTLSFISFLKNVASTQMAVFRHQKYPYDVLLEDLKKKYRFSQNLYDMAISYQNAKTECQQSRVNYDSTWLFNGHCMDTLQIHFYDMDNTGATQIFYDYQVEKLTEADIDRIHHRIMKMCRVILENPDILLKDIEIVDVAEKKQILEVFNHSYLSHPKDMNVYDLIEKIGLQNPNQIAVKDYHTSYTYAELLAKSDQIAKNLVAQRIQKSDIVAVLCHEKSAKLICALLGILRAGACFLAIYPDYPNDRISYMLENSGAKLLLVDDYFSSTNFGVPTLCIEPLENISEDVIFPKASNDDNAYLIYTSGSTGKPKGTMQTHNNLINFIYSFQHFLDNTVNTQDRMLSVTNICFDVSIGEIFMPLLYGATLYLYKDLNYSNPYELAKYIVENNITFSYFPPSMLPSIYEQLKQFKKVPLNKMLVGVEPIRASILQDYLNLNPNMKIVNGYGPSETTICCTMYRFDKTLPADSITPIGSPIGNSKILIYDKNEHLVPIGDIGEIYVQGECVGNGYINNPEMTQEKFDLQNRIYRTGDLAKWLPDGNILFVGRNDNQVKYRGYRIDLGEIEHAIKNLDLIKNCTVMLATRNPENSILVAFCVVKDKMQIDEELIRESLSVSLPHYMIPNQFVFLDDFPITPNGKIDKKSLLELVTSKESAPYVAPSTDLEKKFVTLWGQVLSKEKIGINDNFFEIGGDSLAAIKIVTLLAQDGISISAQNFYMYPTIGLLLKHCFGEEKLEVKQNYIREIDIERLSPTSLENDIFLVGSTGFLGAHILYELLEQTNAKIYCLIRGSSEAHSKSRLQERLHEYFGDTLDSHFDDRIIVMNGDFSKQNLGLSKSKYQFLLERIKTVINTAAVVKHIGKYDYFYKMNILSVENLIHFCEACPHAHLVHISTLSVSGNHCPSENVQAFTEKDLFIGQDINQNVYVQTKFEAEQLLANAIKNGLNATIFRLGNITWRASDGVFQVNSNENLFYNLLNFFITTKKVPLMAKDQVFNISPVDDCARLIVEILRKANNYIIYHITNVYTLTLENIIAILNELGYDIEFVEDTQYQETLNTYLAQYPSIAEQFLHLDCSPNIVVQSPITEKVLKYLDFDWTKISINYMKKKFGGNK